MAIRSSRASSRKSVGIGTTLPWTGQAAPWARGSGGPAGGIGLGTHLYSRSNRPLYLALGGNPALSKDLSGLKWGVTPTGGGRFGRNKAWRDFMKTQGRGASVRVPRKTGPGWAEDQSWRMSAKFTPTYRESGRSRDTTKETVKTFQEGRYGLQEQGLGKERSTLIGPLFRPRKRGILQ